MKAAKNISIRTWTVLLAFSVLFWLGLGVWAFSGGGSNESTKEPRIILGPAVIQPERERAVCEFSEPLKYITLVMHWYDTNEEMYADYIALADPAEHEEIWGWSDCIWQPEDRWAACDVYVVKPDYVRADMNIDTLGHEIFHGACGDFHE